MSAVRRHKVTRSRFSGERHCEYCGGRFLGGSGRPPGECPQHPRTVEETNGGTSELQCVLCRAPVHLVQGQPVHDPGTECVA